MAGARYARLYCELRLVARQLVCAGGLACRGAGSHAAMAEAAAVADAALAAEREAAELGWYHAGTQTHIHTFELRWMACITCVSDIGVLSDPLYVSSQYFQEYIDGLI